MVSSKTILLCAIVTIIIAIVITSSDASPPANSKLHQLIRKSRETKPTRNCKPNEQCKWAVYTEDRLPDYEIKNDCKCDDCERKTDDVQIGAFVYRCKDGS